jgi:hypothetical protein
MALVLLRTEGVWRSIRAVWRGSYESQTQCVLETCEYSEHDE